jgi:hypothetical protein
MTFATRVVGACILRRTGAVTTMWDALVVTRGLESSHEFGRRVACGRASDQFIIDAHRFLNPGP